VSTIHVCSYFIGDAFPFACRYSFSFRRFFSPVLDGGVQHREIVSLELEQAGYLWFSQYFNGAVVDEFGLPVYHNESSGSVDGEGGGGTNSSTIGDSAAPNRASQEVKVDAEGEIEAASTLSNLERGKERGFRTIIILLEDPEWDIPEIANAAEALGMLDGGENDDSFLDTMLLFVAKGAASGFPGMSASSSVSQPGGLSLPGAISAWSRPPSHSALPAPAVATALADNGAGAGKKGKRKHQSHSSMPIGAFARVNPTDMTGRSMNPYSGASSHSSKGRESYRSKILASILARQGGGRASLFQVPSFLLSSIRIRDDVLRRVLRHSRGPAPGGQPLHPMRQSWTRACYKLSSSAKQTGDSALLMSKNQQIRMSTAPAPVDFGPFVAGYISSPYAACGALPRSAAIGISLPMGVKILRRPGEQQAKGWPEAEDKKLKESVLRYGLNWHLVATAVNNFDDEATRRDTGKARPQSRSPGQCHERWNHLVRLDPDLVDALRGVERSRHNNTVTRPSPGETSCFSARRLVKQSSQSTLSVGDTDVALSLVLPSSLFVDKDGDAIMAEETEKPATTKVTGKRSFAALRSAAKKKIGISLPIPGSVDGSKPTLVASHPSHAQAVQSAAAGTSGGKTEMWPLQILDMADKQRAARNASGSSSAGSSRQMPAPPGPSPAQVRSPAARQPSPNRQSRPHASFQVPHAMASPSRSPQTGVARQQGFPAVSANGVPGSRGPPLHGPPPPPSAGKPHTSK